MTDHPTHALPSPQEAPTDAHDGAVGVDVQAVMDAYARELATVTQRAIIAEAGLDAARAQLVEARKTIHALSPGAPTTEEG